MHRGTCSILVVWLALSLGGLSAADVTAADFGAAQAHFDAGEYEACNKIAAEAVEAGIWNVRWPMLLIRCQLTTGQYADALETFEAANKRFTFNALPLQIMGIEVYRMNNLQEQAEQERARIEGKIRQSLGRFMSKDSLLAIGRYLADQGEDARKILELFYDRVIESDPKFADAYVAATELALLKNDFKLAAENIETAIKLSPDDPQLYFLKAQAWEPTDPQQVEAALQIALDKNPKHIPSLLLLAERAIDGEQYADAEKRLAEILTINPRFPQAFAFRAVIAHLQGKEDLEKEERAAALEIWEQNPEVDHLIGRELSQKYRFAEGAEYQRQALVLQPSSSRIAFQLAQDLLHLGDDEAGWALVEQTQEQDPYNVVAFNLIKLHEALADYEVLEENGILLRMDKREAAIYGDQAMQLLQAAKSTLCAKYEVQPDKRVIVEIFPSQKDFAIRTFGLPGGEGYLGVCFGRLITANSPASQGAAPANWQSVLWHEFCHVATLEKTRNRMPRWLSEGISVYEERQQNPRWGEQMNPVYREWILGEELTPVSELSNAFLTPKSALHVQFAYYQSSLVVDFFVERYGLPALLKVLTDLGAGMPINEALQRHSGSLDALNAEFAAYAAEIANAYGPDVDWERPEQQPLDSDLANALLKESPNNYWVLRFLAKQAVSDQDAVAAGPHLDRLDELLPEDVSDGCATALRAELAQQVGDGPKERSYRQQLVDHRPADLVSLRRLAELAAEEEDWEAVRNAAEAILAVQPLLPDGHQWLADSGQESEQPADVVRGLQALSNLDPVDPAGLFFRWGEALLQIDQPAAAKRKLLIALEYAPRYRDAYRLLDTIPSEVEKESP